jgi:hypothetical protein
MAERLLPVRLLAVGGLLPVGRLLLGLLRGRLPALLLLGAARDRLLVPGGLLLARLEGRPHAARDRLIGASGRLLAPPVLLAAGLPPLTSVLALATLLAWLTAVRGRLLRPSALRLVIAHPELPSWTGSPSFIPRPRAQGTPHCHGFPELRDFACRLTGCRPLTC